MRLRREINEMRAAAKPTAEEMELERLNREKRELEMLSQAGPPPNSGSPSVNPESLSSLSSFFTMDDFFISKKIFLFIYSDQKERRSRKAEERITGEEAVG